MIWPLLVVLAAAPALDDSASRLMGERYEAAGRSLPERDEALSAAAHELAVIGLHRSAHDTVGLLRVTAAISRHQGSDPSPKAILIRGSRDEVLPTLRKQLSVGEERATHFGLGAAEEGDTAVLCVLLAERKATIRPFKRKVARAPLSQTLCAQLGDGFKKAEAFATRPDGKVDVVAMKPSNSGDVCAPVSFERSGRHAVEVLARGPQGPEVVALFFVDVGAVTGASADEDIREPPTVALQKAEIVKSINQLRASQSVAAVTVDANLEAVADAYARRMADEEFFGHVAPDGSDLRKRMIAAGLKYLEAGENLGLASGPLSAHFGIEHSPGHRKNLMEPSYTRVGIGIATRADGLSVVVEVLSLPMPVTNGDPLMAAYDAVNAARQKLKLAPLKRSTTLEKLAQAHVKAAKSADTARVDLGGAKSLYDQIFEADESIAQAVADVFVTDAPSLIAESKNLKSKDNSKVGIGLMKVNSAKYGGEKYWVVVIYAIERQD